MPHPFFVKRNILLEKKGFTLIELLVVVAIIGLLSTVIFVSLGSARAKARDMKRKSDMRQVGLALELYYDDYGTYPTNGTYWGECDDFGGHPLTGANGYVPNLAPIYMSVLPLDPKGHNANGSSCCYVYISVGADYKFMAHCTPETGYSSSDSFYDPLRPTWAWQISTPWGRDNL